MADFSTLESLNRMLSPVDFVGTLDGNLGKGNDTSAIDAGIVQRVINMTVDSGVAGVTSTGQMIARLTELVASASPELREQFHDYFTLFTSRGTVASESAKHIARHSALVDGVNVSDITLESIIGSGYQFKPNHDAMVFLSRTPFVQPAVRNVGKVETFMNCMPSIVLGSLQSYIDVEFIFERPGYGITALQTPGLLKFLGGARGVSESDSTADGAMVNARRVQSMDTNGNWTQATYSGMEMFTSPQVMVNPDGIDDESLSYVPPIDKMLPFASMKSFNVDVHPTVGLYTYKTGKLTFTLHDRARLGEVSDLIKPEVYCKTTLWITYGWRAPEDDENPYFKFVNENMLAREAYGIVNASYNFNGPGVDIVLELATRGTSELNDVKITDTDEDARKVLSDVRELMDDISTIRRKLRLQPPAGISKEVRFFKLLDSADAGEFPDLTDSATLASIQEVKRSLSSITSGSPSPNVELMGKLIDKLSQLYATEKGSTGQKTYSMKERARTLATNQLQKKYAELESGPDPFLPTAENDPKNPLVPLIASYLGVEKQNPNIKEFKKGVCSFGKLFSVFALRGILDNIPTVDDVQVYFYSLNKSCGPASATNIACFPIELPVFMDRYRSLMLEQGGERISLKDFIESVVVSQLLDDRALAYGHRQFYQPYNPKDPDAKLIDKKSAQYESLAAAETAKWGPYNRPSLSVLVECLNEAPDSGVVPTSALGVGFSAKDFDAALDESARASLRKKVMRIHVYDRSNSPYIVQGAMLRNESGGFLDVPATDYATTIFGSKLSGLLPSSVALGFSELQFEYDQLTGKVRKIPPVSNMSIKDIIAKTMPYLSYGTVGSTIISSTVASQHDALLSTVQMIKSNTRPNTTQPNGANQGNLPLLVIPTEVSLVCWGNPLLMPAQSYFIDYNTGTTVDNVYVVTGMQHVLAGGKFNTTLKMAFADAYGQYRSAQNVRKYLEQQIADAQA